MENSLPSNFNELIIGVLFILSILFVLLSLIVKIRNHSLRVLGILIISALSISSQNAWSYFATIFIIGTAVTELEFLQKLAAIIRGRNDYFDYEVKKLEFMSRKEVEENKKREVEEVEELSDTNQFHDESSKEDLNSNIMMENNFHSVVRFGFMVEDYVIKHLENKYNCVIQRNRKFKVNNSTYEMDGIMEMDSKIILLEVKTTQREQFPNDFIVRTFTRVNNIGIAFKELYEGTKKIELKVVLVGNFNSRFRSKLEEFQKNNKIHTGISVDFEIYTFEELSIPEFK